MARFLAKIVYCAVLTSFFSDAAIAQKIQRNVRQEITWLKTSLLNQHVAPRTIDDQFSTDLFMKVLEDLDPDRIFFTEKELALLRPFENSLDDEINGKGMAFLTTLKAQYRLGLERSEKLTTALLSTSLDWKKNELYDPQTGWVGDEKELRDRHRQLLKYRVLDRLVEVGQRDSIETPEFFDTHVADAREFVLMKTLRPVKRLLSDAALYDGEISNLFLQAMAAVFDPHSTFLSTAEYGEFISSLSSEDYYFGFTLDEDENGNVVISALAPGGAAWRSGALHVSDIIVAVRWQNEDRIDVGGMNIDDVNEILDQGRSDILEMTVRGVDGNEKQVSLRKAKIESEQNVVQAFILEGDIRVGYIYLPDFYTRWNDDQEGARCANDVAKELIRLKQESIDGVIIDLRFNGGGSLFEACAMAGIFIDEGPLAMFSTQEKKAVSLKDMNRGTVYDGPLVLMVNGASASASEVFAAAIQDFNRGLIVGSPTYGKATGQNTFPVEGMTTVENSPAGTAGYVKVTTQKLYRVTGNSAQGRGVYPDVLLPDVFRAMNVSESQEPFALQRDSVPSNPYFKPLPPLKRKELRTMSSERVSNNEAFRELEKTIAWLTEELSASAGPRSLDWQTYHALMIEEARRREAIRSFKSDEDDHVFKVDNGSSKEARLMLDEYARALNDRWMQALASDIYLQETYQILRDHISITKGPK